MDDKDLNDILNTLATESVPEDVAQLAREASQQFEQQLRQNRRPNFLELLMKSNLTKMAAAAAIIVAALIGFGLLTGGSVTYAKVIQPLLNARTVIMDTIIGDGPDALVMHDIVAGPRIRRTISNMKDSIIILDLDTAKMLNLQTSSHTAIEVDISGTVQQGTSNYLQEIRTIVEKTRKNPDVIKLGESVIDGRKVVGFRLNDPSKLTIYADAETAVPVRIESTLGASHTTITNIQFDPEVDPSLVDMKLPAGYTMISDKLDMSNPTLDDFIATLRIWAEVVNDGVFPDDISTAAQMKTMPVLIEKMKQIPDKSPEQLTQMGMQFARGMIFHQMLTLKGQWRYTGAGVKFATPDKEIARFQTPGSNTWKIIYADLTVKDAQN